MYKEVLGILRVKRMKGVCSIIVDLITFRYSGKKKIVEILAVVLIQVEVSPLCSMLDQPTGSEEAAR